MAAGHDARRAGRGTGPGGEGARPEVGRRDPELEDRAGLARVEQLVRAGVHVGEGVAVEHRAKGVAREVALGAVRFLDPGGEHAKGRQLLPGAGHLEAGEVGKGKFLDGGRGRAHHAGIDRPGARRAGRAAKGRNHVLLLRWANAARDRRHPGPYGRPYLADPQGLVDEAPGSIVRDVAASRKALKRLAYRLTPAKMGSRRGSKALGTGCRVPGRAHRPLNLEPRTSPDEGRCFREPP